MRISESNPATPQQIRGKKISIKIVNCGPDTLVDHIKVESKLEYRQSILDELTGCIDNDWPPSASIALTPTKYIPGLYRCTLCVDDKELSLTEAGRFWFSVRDRSKLPQIIIMLNDQTAAAYNPWGGYNLYGDGSTCFPDQQYIKCREMCTGKVDPTTVSLRRPWIGNPFTDAESLCRWLTKTKRLGYEVWTSD